jgi:hypothetical protein
MEAELARSGPALRAWGVRYLDLPAPTRPDSAALMRVGERDGIDVYAFRRAVGRAYAVRYVLSVPDDEAAARAMATAGFDPAQAAVTTAPGATAEYPGSERCAIRWVRDDPDRQALTVSAPDRAFLVVADSQVPGWTARLDGKPAPILLTDVLVRGLEVPPGEHRIEMEYRTPGMAAGVLVTRVALGFWLALALAAIASLALRSPADSGVPASSKGLDA